MKQNNIIFTITLILIAALTTFLMSIQQKTFAEFGNTSAKCMVIIEADTGRVLYGKDYNNRVPMASTTKIVTALTVLENCDNINKEILVDDRAVGIPGTSIYLKKGERLTIKELLYGMMLPSGNDAATALAYSVGGDITTFSNMMLKTALNAGAINSSFANPHGLDEDNHYTTAYDLAKITAKALENEIFKEIVTTKSTRIKGSKEGTYRYLKNKNKLLNTLNGCIGVKTGFTNKAGRCLVSACERDYRTVCVVLNCGPMFEDSTRLFEEAYSKYSKVNILPSYKILRRIPVVEGKHQDVKLFTRRGFSYPLTESEKNGLEFKYVLPNSLIAPIKKDDCVGELRIYLDNHLLFSEKIYTMDSVDKIGVWSNIESIISNW